MKQIVLSSIAMLLLAAVNTVAQDVRYDFDWKAHFKEFKTYKWIEIKDSPKIGERREEEIKDVLDAQLAKKHLTKSNSDTADLYIAYQVAVSTGRQIASYNNTWGYGPGWNYGGLYGSWYGGWYGFFHTSEGRIRPSTRASWRWIYMTRKTIIWSGAASSVTSSTPQLLRPFKKRHFTKRQPSS